MSDVIAQYPIEVQQTLGLYRGDASVPINLKISAAGSLVPLNTFGSAWTCQLRATPDAPLAAEFTVDATAAAAGVITLNSLDGTATAALTAGATYGADVQATGGDISPITVWRLMFYVEGDYTQ